MEEFSEDELTGDFSMESDEESSAVEIVPKKLPSRRAGRAAKKEISLVESEPESEPESVAEESSSEEIVKKAPVKKAAPAKKKAAAKPDKPSKAASSDISGFFGKVGKKRGNTKASSKPGM